MAIFKRKNNEEEEYEPHFAESDSAMRGRDDGGRRYSRRRDFKDLNSENSKKRKEPKKPWGKKERLFVLLVILATVGTSGILALSSRSWKVGGFPRITLPSFQIPSIKLFGEETIILNKVERVDQAQRVEQERKAKEITEEFKNQTKNLTGVYGLYVVDLTTGYSFGVNENEVFEPASLNKLPIMAEMYKKSEENSLSLSSQFKLQNEDKIGGSGSLASKPAGMVLTYRDLIRYMGKESDNTAVHIARNILDESDVVKLISQIGMGNTDIYSDNQTTTPKDIGTYFQKLWNGEIVSLKDRDELLVFMTKTIYENWLVAGIPDDVRVAHKYGREVHIVNDAGIVFTDKPFVLVIMSRGVNDREADEVFPELARSVYQLKTEN